MEVDAWGVIFKLTMVVLKIWVCELVDNLFDQVDNDEASNEDKLCKRAAIVLAKGSLVKLSDLNEELNVIRSDINAYF